MPRVRGDAGLRADLNKALRASYLVSGDETLLVEEACDAILGACRAGGYTERSVHHADTGFKWGDLHHDAASLSLFAERKVLDVRLSPKRFDREGSDALRGWLKDHASDDPDVVLLLRTQRLDGRQRQSAWYKALEKAGVVMEIWPLSPAELPGWLAGRLKQRGMQAEPDALGYLSDRVEGNLLSAVQEIDKLQLLDLPQPLTLASMVECLEDASRFNSFDLLDAVMAGEAERVVHILAVLRDEGVSMFAILGALSAQIRNRDNARGPRDRMQRMENFFRRIRNPDAVLAECALLDQQGKGQIRGDAWLSMERLMLRLAGQRSLSLLSEDLRL